MKQKQRMTTEQKETTNNQILNKKIYKINNLKESLSSSINQYFQKISQKLLKALTKQNKKIISNYELAINNTINTLRQEQIQCNKNIDKNIEKEELKYLQTRIDLHINKLSDWVNATTTQLNLDSKLINSKVKQHIENMTKSIKQTLQIVPSMTKYCQLSVKPINQPQYVFSSSKKMISHQELIQTQIDSQQKKQNFQKQNKLLKQDKNIVKQLNYLQKNKNVRNIMNKKVQLELEKQIEVFCKDQSIKQLIKIDTVNQKTIQIFSLKKKDRWLQLEENLINQNMQANLNAEQRQIIRNGQNRLKKYQIYCQERIIPSFNSYFAAYTKIFFESKPSRQYIVALVEGVRNNRILMTYDLIIYNYKGDEIVKHPIKIQIGIPQNIVNLNQIIGISQLKDNKQYIFIIQNYTITRLSLTNELISKKLKIDYNQKFSKFQTFDDSLVVVSDLNKQIYYINSQLQIYNKVDCNIFPLNKSIYKLSQLNLCMQNILSLISTQNSEEAVTSIKNGVYKNIQLQFQEKKHQPNNYLVQAVKFNQDLNLFFFRQNGQLKLYIGNANKFHSQKLTKIDEQQGQYQENLKFKLYEVSGKILKEVNTKSKISVMKGKLYFYKQGSKKISVFSLN